ncbi:MAG TPA: hypothetical protein VFZ06_09545, partial [Acidimicrobiia bacterium]|nr:hypothetical protein [Acidimicrobiia bacterium]
ARDGERPDPESIVGDHSWSARVATLFELLGWDPVESATEPVRIETRPVRHYPPEQRLLPH